MSGLTTAIAIGSLAVGALGVGVSAYNGVKSSDAQAKALALQTTSTQTAEANALSTERKNETATNAANQQTPNIAGILTQAANISKAGVGSTMLTGTGGVSGGSLNLGKTSLLG
jgi:hypothetical protein